MNGLTACRLNHRAVRPCVSHSLGPRREATIELRVQIVRLRELQVLDVQPAAASSAAAFIDLSQLESIKTHFL